MNVEIIPNTQCVQAVFLAVAGLLLTIRNLVGEPCDGVRSWILTFWIFVGLTTNERESVIVLFQSDELFGSTHPKISSNRSRSSRRFKRFKRGDRVRETLELVLAVAADTGVWTSKYVTSTRAPEK
jgi:hypothetical protein